MKNKIKDLLFDSNKGKIKLNDKASIFFFCLLLSTFFWFLSSLSKEYTTSLTIPIQYTSFNKNFILMEKPIESITVRVVGSGFELLGEQMSLNRKSIDVDLEKARVTGKNRSAIPTSTLKNELLAFLDKDLNFIEIQTDSIVLVTEPRIAKKVKVIPNLDLDFESGYNLMGDVVVKPSEIIVSGPQSRLDTLDAIDLKKLSFSELEDTVTQKVNLSNIDFHESLRFEPSTVDLMIPVEKFTEKVFEVPLNHNITVEEISIRTFPNRVKVTFSVPLGSYEKLEEGDFIAAVEVGKEELTKSKLKVTIKGTPNYAKLLRVEPERVEYIIKK